MRNTSRRGRGGDNERANGRFGGGALDTGNQFPRREAGTIIEELGAASCDTLVNALSTSALYPL